MRYGQRLPLKRGQGQCIAAAGCGTLQKLFGPLTLKQNPTQNDGRVSIPIRPGRDRGILGTPNLANHLDGDDARRRKAHLGRGSCCHVKSLNGLFACVVVESQHRVFHRIVFFSFRLHTVHWSTQNEVWFCTI